MNESAPQHPHSRPIWAPWRIEYIRAPKEKGCFLCDKGRGGKAAEHVIHRGDQAYVLLNEFPYNSGHLMVAPLRHVGDLADLTAEERREIMELLVQCQKVLTHVMAPQGFNIGFNIGTAAGAGVAEHVHGHVVPRWEGDTNFMPVFADVRVIPEALDQTADLIRQAWQQLA